MTPSFGKVINMLINGNFNLTFELYDGLGLYANSKVNLNTPLLGIWTMNSLAVRTVTDSITDLQNRVVKIIPFNFLTVDTR